VVGTDNSTSHLIKSIWSTWSPEFESPLNRFWILTAALSKRLILHVNFCFMTRICRAQYPSLCRWFRWDDCWPESEDPEPLILGSRNFYKLLSPMKLRRTTWQNLSATSPCFRYTKLNSLSLVHTPFGITTVVDQLHCLQGAIGHQHEGQKKQSDLTKWFTVTVSGFFFVLNQLCLIPYIDPYGVWQDRASLFQKNLSAVSRASTAAPPPLPVVPKDCQWY